MIPIGERRTRQHVGNVEFVIPALSPKWLFSSKGSKIYSHIRVTVRYVVAV